MVTQEEVAQKAGVSFITVSRVINNKGYVKAETREKVQKAIKELNYYTNHIGRALHMKSVNSIGVLIPKPVYTTVHNTDYYNLLMAGVEDPTMAHGFDMLLSTYVAGSSEIDYLRLYYQRKVDGIILITPDLEHPQIKTIEEKNIPCVIIGDRPGELISYVDTDNFAGTVKVVEYLVSKGKKNIAFIKDASFTRNALDRYNGFVKAMEKYSLPVKEEWMFEGNFAPESGSAAVKKLHSLSHMPDTLVCSNDLEALGALNEAKNLGIRIPEDIALIGFDGIAATAYTDPPLSTVRQPLFEMGKTASEFLFNKIEDPSRSPEVKIFPVELIQRKSV